MEEGENGGHKAHVVVLPFSGQGHINPMFQFSKRLASMGVKITLATTLSVATSVQTGVGSITLQSIYDDFSEISLTSPGGFKAFSDNFQACASRDLAAFIRAQSNSDCPVSCLVYDANLPWALAIARQLGILSAAFFTQSCTAIAAYYLMHLDLTGQKSPAPSFSLPKLPVIGLPSLPSLGSDSGPYPPVIMHILRQFNDIDQADWVLFNSFAKLETEVVKWMSELWPVRTIGPTIPSIYLDNRLKDDIDYGFNLYNPESDNCMRWLSKRESGSVLYVSFGSAARLSGEQMREMARALTQSKEHFIWVVKEGEERENLPLAETGIVVRWCNQLAVLADPAVGCFVTHCGWNSTVEALSLGVPMIAMPQFLDQITNAYCVEEIWRVGARPKLNDRGVASADEIERCIREVMRGEEIKMNAEEWKQSAKAAVEEGGSLDQCLDEMLTRLVGGSQASR